MQNTSLGKKLRQARKEMNLTQEQLAGQEFTKGFISLLELDKANPSLDSLVKLAARLNKPLSYFLEDKLESKYEIDIYNAIGEVTLYLSGSNSAMEYFRRAMDLSEELQDNLRKAVTQRNMAKVMILNGNLEEAFQLLSQAAAAFKASEAFEELAETYEIMGLLHERQDRLLQAIEDYLKCLELFQAAGEPQLKGHVALLAKLSNVYMKAKKYEDAERISKTVLDSLNSGTNLFEIVQQYVNLATACKERGDLLKSLVLSLKALSFVELNETLNLLADVHVNFGKLLAQRGLSADAVQHFHQSLKLRDITGNKLAQTQVYIELAKYELERNNIEAAEKSCNLALASLQGHADEVQLAKIHLLFGLIEKARKGWANALKNFEIAAKLFASSNMIPELANTYSEMGFTYAELGDPKQANDFLARSVALFREFTLNGTMPREHTALSG